MDFEFVRRLIILHMCGFFLSFFFFFRASEALKSSFQLTRFFGVICDQIMDWSRWSVHEISPMVPGELNQPSYNNRASPQRSCAKGPYGNRQVIIKPLRLPELDTVNTLRLLDETRFFVLHQNCPEYLLIIQPGLENKLVKIVMTSSSIDWELPNEGEPPVTSFSKRFRLANDANVWLINCKKGDSFDVRISGKVTWSWYQVVINRIAKVQEIKLSNLKAFPVSYFPAGCQMSRWYFCNVISFIPVNNAQS